MNSKTIVQMNLLVACLFGFLSGSVNSVQGDDWSSIRGNEGLGRWTGQTILSESDKMGLRIRWKKKIGSGYSSVVVSKGKALTMYTDGEKDRVICLDVRNGKSIWNQELEPMFKGSNGSFDGPIATPVVHEGIVYCLTARGKLFAFELESGKKNWMRDLVKEEKAANPMYGFSTTPIAHGDTLCVLAGTDKGVLIGIDTKTGATKWRAGTGQVASQIPMITKINGKETLVTGAGRSVIGVDPASGKLLFEFKHNGSNGSAMMPVPLGNDRVLLTNDDSFSRVFQIKPADSGFDVSEVWTNRSIKNSYNVPVAVKGNLFAYSTRILTCVDQETGNPKWKSRKPGDGFLIEVDGHLVICTKKGSVHIAKASPKKYDEKASVKVFDNLVWAIPAYADNAVYVRSLGEIACVEFVGRTDSSLAGNKFDLPMSKGFREFVTKVNSQSDAKEKRQLIETFLDAQPVFPVIEDGIAHFLFQGKADDVALACDVFGARQEEKMVRIPETDLFYYTLELPADQRVSYVFLKNYVPQTDPKNPRKMTSSMYAGEMEFAIRLRNEKPLEMSWFGMSEWKAPQWMSIHRKERLAGKLVEENIKVGDSGEFKATVYLPPQYEQDEKSRFPVVYVHDGEQALKLGEIDEAADLYFQSQPERAAILVFLRSPPELGLPVYLGRVAKSVVPFIDKKYRTKTERISRLSYGAGFASSFAMAQAAQHSDLFGACATQSPLVFDQARKMAIEGFGKLTEPTKLYIEWGRFDMHNPVENWDIREMAGTMQKEIGRNKNVVVTGGQVNDSTDWSSWRYRIDKVVNLLFQK